MTWRSSAQALLDAAAGAPLTAPLARSYLAPGPSFARDCRQIVVHPDPLDVGTVEGLAVLPVMSCAAVPILALRVVFHADCWPVPGDGGTLPEPADLSAWTDAFLEDTESIWGAVADAAEAGSLGSDCGSVQLLQSTYSGPLGAGATFQLPVRLLSI